MTIVKTNMTEIPNSCKECELVVKTFGVYLCPLLKDWIERWQIAEQNKLKPENCPLEEQK